MGQQNPLIFTHLVMTLKDADGNGPETVNRMPQRVGFRDIKVRDGLVLFWTTNKALCDSAARRQTVTTTIIAKAAVGIVRVERRSPVDEAAQHEYSVRTRSPNHVTAFELCDIYRPRVWVPGVETIVESHGFANVGDISSY